MTNPFFPRNQSIDLRRLRDIIGKCKSRGMAWLLDRVAKELRVPETKEGLVIRRITSALLGAARIIVSISPLFILTLATKRRRLYYYFDLDVSPATFDIVNYIMLVEWQRRQLGCDDIHVVIVPGRSEGFRTEDRAYDQAVPLAKRHWRLHNVIIPALTMMPSVSGYSLCSDRRQAWLLRLMCRGPVLPKDYWPSIPYSLAVRPLLDAARQGEPVFPGLYPPDMAREYVGRWLNARSEGRRTIVITLRQYEFEPDRNSNIAAWVDFARNLDARQWLPIFIQDTDAAMTALPPELDGMTVFEAGPWNLFLRSAIYEAAWLNMAVVQGPMTLCWFNEACRYVAFLPPDTSPQTDEDAMFAAGYMPGQSLPFATPLQRWKWELDGSEAINRAFAEMVEAIEQFEQATSAKP